MSIQFKRGTGVANDSYTGLDGEISIDETNQNIRVHDGTTPGGGFSVGSGGGDATNLDNTTTATDVTITSSTGTDTTIAGASGTDAGVMVSADKTKLDGIESGATQNSSDTVLLDRSNHTGTQTASTISDFDTAVVSAVETNNIDFGVL